MHLLHRSNDTGRVREVTITDQPGAKLSAAARRKAPLSKGAGTAGEPPVAFAVTEGFYSRDFL